MIHGFRITSVNFETTSVTFKMPFNSVRKPSTTLRNAISGAYITAVKVLNVIHGTCYIPTYIIASFIHRAYMSFMTFKMQSMKLICHLWH